LLLCSALLGCSVLDGCERDSIIKGLSVASLYTYLIAKDENTGFYITCSPKHTARLDIKYRPLEKLSIMFNNKYVSKQFSRSDNSESVSYYYIADLRAEYYIKMIRLFPKVENMFDNDYDYGIVILLRQEHI